MPKLSFCCLVVVCLIYPSVLSGAQNQDLPILGDATSGIISLEQERKLGQDFLRSLRAQAPTISDPLLKDYLEYLIYFLAEHSQLQDRRLDLVILDSRQLNAFAVPGGIVGINLGLFLYAETRNEFSAILAHELAHISQRHFARGVENARRNTLPNLAGLLASIIIMATSGGDAGIAALTATQAAAQQKALKYSRSREAEADRIGILTLADAGMDPRAMAYMFERLSNMNRFAGQRLPEFLLTHPVTQSRISDSYNQTRQYEDTDFPLNLDYQLMRVRILMSDEASPEISVKRMRDGLNTDDPTIRMAYQYGLVLALSRTTKIDESMELLRPLIKQYPEKIAFVLAQAEIEMAAQRYENAIDLLQTKLKISPDNFPLSMQYADALLKADKVLEAQRVLERQVALRPNDADIWYLLAETHGLAKDIAAVHQARAEYFMLNGNLDQAIKHLNYALPLVGDNFQMIARIKQRLQDFHLMQQEKL
jgi:predicted Zn-dependent protease